MWNPEKELPYRHQVLMKWYWVFGIVNLIMNQVSGYPYMGYLLITWAVPLTILTYLSILGYSVHKLMYGTILSMFMVVWVWIYLNPSLLNFIFIWFILIVSSFYQNKKVILFAGFLTFLSTISAFYTYHDDIFSELKDHHIIILLLFDMVIILYLYLTTRYLESLRAKIEQSEAQVGMMLHSTREYLESFIRNTTDALVVTDLTGRVIKVNPAFEMVFGWKEWETLGHSLSQLTNPDEGEVERVITQVLRQMEPITFDTVNRTKDGQAIDINVVVSPIRNQEGTIIAMASLARDITERKRTAERLLRTEKLAAVGQLAAAVTHEIRNPLTVLSGFTQLIAEKNPDPTTQSYCNLMKSEIDRIHMIVSEFLVFAKPQAERLVEYDLHRLILETVALMEPEAHQHQTTLRCFWKGSVPLLHCDPNAIKQVLINLIKNSIEAMPTGGGVRLEVEGKEEEVVIRVQDEGMGMDETTLHHLTEPFFTSKEHGTGLGMAISQKIISNHGGQLCVESKLHEGTRVELRLPVCGIEQGQTDEEERT